MGNMDKKSQLISYLYNQTDWITAGTLAGLMNISVRSVKYCISEINREHPAMIRSSNRGYKIDKAAGQIMVSSSETDSISIPRNFEERKRVIIITLLMENQKPTVDNLADRLCISPTTLQKELSRLSAELSEYHLNVHTKNNIVTITGLTEDKRKYIVKLINSEIQESYFSINRVNEMFTNVDLKEIEHLVTDTLRENEYFLDNYSLFNYVLHIALTIELRESNDPKDFIAPPYDPESMENLKCSPSVEKIVREIYQKLKKLYNTEYTMADIYQASVLMMTRIVANNADTLRYDQIKDTLGEDISLLLEDILSSVYDTYLIDLRSENFLIRFAFHLKNLQLRLSQGIPLTNLQLEDIRNNYPLIYVIAVHISVIVQKHFGYPLPENEISYIALHVGALIDENNALAEKIRTVIVCSDYATIGKRVFRKISATFSETLLITDQMTSLSDEASLSNTELILSTEPLNPSLSIRHYIMSPFVSETDIRNIMDIINDIKNRKLKNTMRNKITYFFHEDLFFADEDFKTDTDVIEALCGKMISQQYVAPSYKDAIYAHEAISPSSYGNVAIPHPLSNRAKTSVIAVSLNPRPIHWGINDVNLVFMLSLREEDRNLFKDIFEFITRILQDDEASKKLLAARTFTEFINLLLSFY